MERKLASIQIINDIQPIEGADNIEVATVNAWKLVVKKGEFKVGDKCVYCEIDCFMPDRPEFEFLKPRGMRIRTVKLRGQISQGICFPLSILPYDIIMDTNEGTDVTEQLGIIKYEPTLPACLAGRVKGNFPSFIPKTDEERIQNLSKHYQKYKETKFYVAEKLDGSSATYYLKNGVFGVCSRNLDLLETEGNSFWSVARQLDIEDKLRLAEGWDIALQGELIGEGIQGNPYKLKGQTVYFFNAFNIASQEYLNYESFINLMMMLDLNYVLVLVKDYDLPETIADLLLFAEGKSALHKDTEREGLVIRSHCRTISFKVISNKFLLKEK